jgi:hypothetical protein
MNIKCYIQQRYTNQKGIGMKKYLIMFVMVVVVFGMTTESRAQGISALEFNTVLDMPEVLGLSDWGVLFDNQSCIQNIDSVGASVKVQITSYSPTIVGMRFKFSEDFVLFRPHGLITSLEVNTTSKKWHANIYAPNNTDNTVDVSVTIPCPEE